MASDTSQDNEASVSATQESMDESIPSEVESDVLIQAMVLLLPLTLIRNHQTLSFMLAHQFQLRTLMPCF